jgi:catechol 2,3-dioxygenase
MIEIKPSEPNPNPIDRDVSIGHVHMRAGDLEKIEEFYVDILGFSIMARYPEAIFIAAGNYHHHLAFNTWESKNGSPAQPHNTGLYHIAIKYPTKKSLADALKRLKDANWHIDGLSDHGTQLALYLRDPEENGVELYWDRPRSEWPLDTDGHLQFTNKLFSLDDLMKEL